MTLSNPVIALRPISDLEAIDWLNLPNIKTFRRFMQSLSERIRHFKVVYEGRLLQEFYRKRTAIAFNDNKLTLTLRAQNKEAIHRVQPLCSDAFGKVNEAHLLVVEDFLHSVALVAGERYAWILEI